MTFHLVATLYHQILPMKERQAIFDRAWTLVNTTDAESRFGFPITNMTIDITQDARVSDSEYTPPEAGATLPILPQWIIVLALTVGFMPSALLYRFVKKSEVEESGTKADDILHLLKMWDIILFELSRAPVFVWADIEGDFEYANDPSSNVRSFAILLIILSYLSFGKCWLEYSKVRFKSGEITDEKRRRMYAYLLVGLSAFDMPQVILYSAVEAGKLGSSAGAIIGILNAYPFCEKIFKILRLYYPKTFETTYETCKSSLADRFAFLLKPAGEAAADGVAGGAAEAVSTQSSMEELTPETSTNATPAIGREPVILLPMAGSEDFQAVSADCETPRRPGSAPSRLSPGRVRPQPQHSFRDNEIFNTDLTREEADAGSKAGVQPDCTQDGLEFVQA